MKRLISILSVLILIISVLNGCSVLSPAASPDPSPSDRLSDNPDEVSGNPGGLSLPLVSEPLTLSYWITYPLNLSEYGGKSFDSSISFQEMERKTGVHIRFIHPSGDNVYQDYKLMIASRDLPDLINTPEDGFPGGIESAIETGIYIKLNDYLEQYAPNYWSSIHQTGGRLRDAITDSGFFAAFWQINEPEQGPWIGPAVRKDWLDKVGIDSPVTVSDWEEMLRLFRDEIGSDEPYRLNYNGIDPYSNILSAFGIGGSFYKIDKTVHFGPAEEEYFSYLRLMRQWYAEGLINQSFYNQRDSVYMSGIQDGTGASTVMYTDLGIGDDKNQYINNPMAHTVAVPYPVLKEGDKIHIRRYNPDIANANASITTACNDIITAIRWLDYGYSDEGAMILNYGVENVTYKYVEGIPIFTDLILKNPDGTPPIYSMRKTVSTMHPTLYYWQRELPLISEDGIDAIDRIWPKADAAYVMPPITLSTSEGRDFVRQMEQINTYVTEITVKVIMGLESPNIYNEYIIKLEALGLRNVLEIQQAALNRYYKR